MNKEKIIKVEIDNSGKLHLKPELTKFTLIYRTATEIHWDIEKQTLYSPKPREWSYLDWFKNILTIVKNEFSCCLYLTEGTEWVNIPNDLKKEITKAQHNV